jgi:hypothetical protein
MSLVALYPSMTFSGQTPIYCIGAEQAHLSGGTSSLILSSLENFFPQICPQENRKRILATPYSDWQPPLGM